MAVMIDEIIGSLELKPLEHASQRTLTGKVERLPLRESPNPPAPRSVSIHMHRNPSFSPTASPDRLGCGSRESWTVKTVAPNVSRQAVP